MATPTDQDASFDPRSWGRRDAPAQPASSTDSFDPRGWGKSAAPPAPPPPSRTAAAAARPGDPRLIASGVSLAIALVGAVAAFVARPDSGPIQPPPPPVKPIKSAPGLELRTLIVPGAGDLAPNLLAAGIASGDATAAARLVGAALKAPSGDIRLELALAGQENGAARLRQLTATQADGSGVALVARGDAGFDATPITAKLVRRLEFVRGELDGASFYSSAVSAGVSDVLVDEFANAFRYDFDMQREVAKGDVFEAGFEQPHNASGDPVGQPVLVYASLSTATKSRALYRFRPAGAPAEWVDASGRSSRRSLMRTPVEAARISSRFGPRGHPILGFVKMHRGTDFAAPTGTPIFAAGDATVTFAAFKGANGNFVRLRHDNGWDTLYLHLHHFAPGLAPGMRVLQGQQIGAVGTTGRSTGPHLHYEVHIDGAAVDPLSIDTGSGRTLTGAALAAFRKARDTIDAGRVAGG